MTSIVRALADFPADADIEKDATIRGEHVEYRYDLTRIWDRSLPICVFTMLNPSTADGKTDDATIRKCERFAFLWGYGGIVVVNLFAYRATKPAVLRPLTAEVAVGPLNDDFIAAAVSDAGEVICAWGSEKFAAPRAEVVTGMLRRVCLITPRYLRLARSGAPWHPLYVPYSELPKAF